MVCLIFLETALVVSGHGRMILLPTESEIKKSVIIRDVVMVMMLQPGRVSTRLPDILASGEY